ncbi:MAG: acyl-CoA/acyl-ACP dehydrogenase [Polyangiaceae bacterium]|jgi:alkylation response protein AidB-like acyl-CoA dehydrogenase|nr:acyl-CoA/acyl-ACP dehydrogenase [Polyangiaceae bacterium]MBK8936512.1 acyl-CoA/acyl-ACP dehydrogenase [Polyangiaceae bacterium]
MSNRKSDILSEIDRVAREIVGPFAPKADADGAFPEPSLSALAASGAFGLLSAESVGGKGLGLRQAAEVIERVARECGSTAMILAMHYSAAAVLEKYAPEALRREVAKDRLVTLAFSEAGSRSHFWAPVSTATAVASGVRLDAKKSWATSARHADYVWSSKPLAAEGASTIWFVPRTTAGLTVPGRFDGLGLRGNDSAPVLATAAVIPAANQLGADGGGFGIMMETVLPVFSILNAASSIGMMEAAVARAAEHAKATSFEHLGAPLRELPTIRAYLARMRVMTDQAKALLGDTLSAIESGRPDATLRVLESKASAGETSTAVLDLAMRVCGGAAFRKEVGVERLFRDTRAATVMAPTTDVLYDFIGKAVTGMDLF